MADKIIQKLSPTELENLTVPQVIAAAITPLSRKASDYSLELNGYSFIVAISGNNVRIIFVNTGLVGGAHWGGFAFSCLQFTAGVALSVAGAFIPPVAITGSALVTSGLESGAYSLTVNYNDFTVSKYAKYSVKGAATGAVLGAVTCLAPGAGVVSVIGKFGGKAASFASGLGGSIVENVVTGSLKYGCSGIVKEIIDKKVVHAGDADNKIQGSKLYSGFFAGAIAQPLVHELSHLVSHGIHHICGNNTVQVASDVALQFVEGASKGALKQVVQNYFEDENLTKDVVKQAIFTGLTQGVPALVIAVGDSLSHTHTPEHVTAQTEDVTVLSEEVTTNSADPTVKPVIEKQSIKYSSPMTGEKQGIKLDKQAVKFHSAKPPTLAYASNPYASNPTIADSTTVVSEPVIVPIVASVSNPLTVDSTVIASGSIVVSQPVVVVQPIAVSQPMVMSTDPSFRGKRKTKVIKEQERQAAKSTEDQRAREMLQEIKEIEESLARIQSTVHANTQIIRQYTPIAQSSEQHENSHGVVAGKAESTLVHRKARIQE